MKLCGVIDTAESKCSKKMFEIAKKYLQAMRHITK